MSNYAGCEELKNAILDLKKVINERGHEKKQFENFIRKAKWYQLKSANKGVLASCSHDTSSSSSCNDVSTLETTVSETQMIQRVPILVHYLLLLKVIQIFVWAFLQSSCGGKANKSATEKFSPTVQHK